MMNQNKFDTALLKKLAKADDYHYAILKKQVQKTLLGAELVLTSRITRYSLDADLGLEPGDAALFSQQLIEKLRRHTFNVFELVEISRKKYGSKDFA